MTCKNGSIDGAHPCTEPSSYRYTWPGQEPSELCTVHMRKLSKSANVALLDVTALGNAPPFTPAPVSDVVRAPEREPDFAVSVDGDADELGDSSRPGRR